jgi:tRNA-dihydrouridine synthase 2
MKGADYFRGKLFAGPMVRASCLPFRLQCLEYGADGVFGPATSCESILVSHIDDSDPYTLYFGWPDKPYVHFRSHRKEHGKLVFQILAHDSSTAIQAVEKVVGFASAIDINCGCPESFATSKGNGSALMAEPEKVADIISGLSRNFDLPISVKHRIHNSIEKSIHFSMSCEKAGCSAITIHGRQKEQKNTGEVAYNDMKLIFEHLNVAKIGNGRVKSLAAARDMMAATGCDSVMISSGAIKNPSVFREDMLNVIDVARRYVEIAEQCGCEDKREWKWLLTTMLGQYRRITKTETYRELVLKNQLMDFREVLFRPAPFEMADADP